MLYESYLYTVHKERDRETDRQTERNKGISGREVETERTLVIALLIGSVFLVHVTFILLFLCRQ